MNVFQLRQRLVEKYASSTRSFINIRVECMDARRMDDEL